MKNSEEMVNSLLERRDRYVTEQKKKKAIITRTATSMCCVCLVALLGFGMWQGGMFNTTPSNQTVEDAPYPGIKDNFDESKGGSPDNPTANNKPDNSAANNKIVISTISGIPSNDMRLNLAVEDFVEMSREEMIEYYGIDYFPVVPADMEAWEGGRLGIFKRNGGTGEVYWDQNILNYSNQDVTRHINIEVAKGNIPFLDYGIFSVEDETSVINNVELKIGLTDDGHYFTEFMYKNVGFIISAKGLTQDEFVSAIASIIK